MKSALKIVALLLVMVLAQLHLLEHGLEHAFHDHDEACLVCELGKHQGDALVTLPADTARASRSPAPAARLYSVTTQPARYYPSRAPPLPFV